MIKFCPIMSFRHEDDDGIYCRMDECALFKHVVESDVYGFQEINEECERYWIQKQRCKWIYARVV